MDVDEKLAGVERRFNDLRARKDALTQEMQEVDNELYRLQGENRLLLAMKEPDPAMTVEAKPKVEAKRG